MRAAAALLVTAASAVEYCRPTTTTNHGPGTWTDLFDLLQPTSVDLRAVCDGELILPSNSPDEFCSRGRMTYQQLATQLDGFGFTGGLAAPAATSISLTGHLLTGSGNVVLGSSARFLSSYVTSFKVEAHDGSVIESVAPDAAAFTDLLLAASRGVIQEVCYSRDILQPESAYQITTTFWRGPLTDASALGDVSVSFFSRYFACIETHSEGSIHEVSRLSALAMSLFNAFANIPLPSWLLRIVPVLSLSGLLRQIFIGGTYSTAEFPQPVVAPDLAVDVAQVDAPFSSFLSIVDSGFFADNLVPYGGGVLLKRIPPAADGTSCWDVEVASIDIQIYAGGGDLLDAYLDQLYGALSQHGPVSMSVGKRLTPSGSRLLNSTKNFYAQCGAQTDLDTDTPCYHPFCRRTSELHNFEYPAELFQ